MGVGACLDHVTLFDLLGEERVEAVLARPEGVDLSHESSIAANVLVPPPFSKHVRTT